MLCIQNYADRGCTKYRLTNVRRNNELHVLHSMIRPSRLQSFLWSKLYDFFVALVAGGDEKSANE